jgi:hypothetical protein
MSAPGRRLLIDRAHHRLIQPAQPVSHAKWGKTVEIAPDARGAVNTEAHPLQESQHCRLRAAVRGFAVGPHSQRKPAVPNPKSGFISDQRRRAELKTA